MKKYDFYNLVCIDLIYIVSLCKDCQLKVEIFEFGVYVIVSVLLILVFLVYFDDKVGFWEFVCMCICEVYVQLDFGKYFDFLKFYYCFGSKVYCNLYNYENNEGCRSQIIIIINCGVFQISQGGECLFKFVGMYFGLRGERLGYVFGNNILMVDGRFYWVVEYFLYVIIKE